MKFQSTVAENFQSWDKFLDAYYEPIRTALGLIPFVGEDRADDLAQSFFLKLYERDILENRPAITGRFRNWLYVAARHHAVDEWRKSSGGRERPDAFEAQEPADPRLDSPDDAPFDADEFYALSVLHMTVGRVHKHLLEEGKSEHWMIFEELVLAPLIPGRVPKTREELLAMFPGQGARLSGQSDHDRQAGLPAHPPRPDPRRPDREPDARRAVRGVAGNPPRLEEQPALAGLPDQSHARTGRIDRLVARPGGRPGRGGDVRGDGCPGHSP